MPLVASRVVRVFWRKESAVMTISLRTGLIVSFATVVLLVGGTILATTFSGSERATRSLSRNLVVGAADRAEAEIRAAVEPVFEELALAADWAEGGLLSPVDVDAARSLVVPFLERNRRLDAIMVADDRGRELLLLHREGRLGQRETRVGEWGSELRWSEWPGRLARGEPSRTRERADYDPRQRPWFQGALEERRAGGFFFTTPPYVFPGTEVLGVTMSVATSEDLETPVVVAFAIRLDRIQELANEIEVSDNGRIVILSDTGRLLGVPDDVMPEAARQEDWLFQFPRDIASPLLQAASAAYASGEGTPGAPRRFRSGGEVWWSQARAVGLPSNVWLVVVLLPQSDLLGDRASIRRDVLAVTGVALALALLAALLLGRRFSRPIEALVRNSDRISTGDFERGEEFSSSFAEIETLQRAQVRMRRSLRTLVKLEEDLEVARQIQTSTLPSTLPRLAGWDFAASCEPAEQTGGDTYDAFGLDEDSRLIEDGVEAESVVFLLADATGHGIGPALAVTQLRAMLRGGIRTGAELGRMAAHLNDQLTADLPGNRFITAWVAVLRRTGRLRYVSAGQGPLLLYRAADAAIESFDATAPPLGLFPEMEVALSEPLMLAPGDVFVALTDGFFEARSPAGDEIGREGVAEVVRRHAEGSAEDIRAALVAAVEDFAEGRPVGDDRTAIVLKRVGSGDGVV